MKSGVFNLRQYRPCEKPNDVGVTLVNVARVSTPVYRTFKVNHFLNVVRDRQLVLVKPKLWDDPFENILQSSEVPITNRFAITLHSHYDEFFGQCWSYGKENDATWRLYSPNPERGVRVGSTVGVLARSLCESGAGTGSNVWYIGQVMYLPPKKIGQMLMHPEIEREIHQKVLRAIFRGSDDFARIPLPQSTTSALTLFVKRPEFSYEREVRIIYREHDEHFRRDSVRRFPFDPNNTFHRVIVDPRLSRHEYDNVVRELTAAGYRGDIRQSSLYRVPRYKLDFTKNRVRRITRA